MLTYNHHVPICDSRDDNFLYVVSILLEYDFIILLVDKVTEIRRGRKKKQMGFVIWKI